MNASVTTSPIASSPQISNSGPQLIQQPAKLTAREIAFWCALVIMVAVGCLGLSPQLISLWDIWANDPLRSIGMLLAPASILLTLRVWKHYGWELRGTWWGVLPIAVSYFSIVSSQNLVFSWGSGPRIVNLIPHVLPIYLYASGIILLFAGARVWKKAWFPLALLLLLQPVPAFVVSLLDLPLQSKSAHIARSFAVLIGFPPTNPDLLRLMFTPDFGMFIAPGCDGMRGAVTLGYVALIVGYLKRVSFVRWFAYVVGAVLLGHLFNLIRLCALVLYYRIAVGHHGLEQVAKQADYVIGACLFLIATLLFFRIVMRKQDTPEEAADLPASHAAFISSKSFTGLTLKYAAFIILVLIAAVPGVRAIEFNRESLATSSSSRNMTPQQLDARVPKQLGAYKLVRTWQEQMSGASVLENVAYATPSSHEITLGVWLKPTGHSVHESWTTHGETPQMRTLTDFTTANNRTVSFDTAFYTDGVTDSFAGNTYCTPTHCLSSVDDQSKIHVGFTRATDFTTRGARLVPIYFRIEMVHTGAPKEEVYKQLAAQSQIFLSNVDLGDFSAKFQ
jgi:exosortase J